jgi:FixJ family two-component response regulator
LSEAVPTVFVVDDDPAVLKGLERLLRSARLNVATFASPQEFLQRHDPRVPGCVLLDVAMPGLNGLELQKALAERGGATPIVFLSGQGDVPTSVRAMKHGALDFLTKPVDDEELLAAVQAALRNDQVARRARVEVDDILQRIATLTPREREVLGHVIAGHLNKQAAAEMGTVEKTIKVHRARMMEKMGVQSVAELVRLAEKAQVAPAAPTPLQKPS